MKVRLRWNWFPKCHCPGGSWQMRYCSSIHTARELDYTRSMLMIEAEGWTFPLESIVPSNTWLDLVCLKGINAGHTRWTRRHCFGLTQYLRVPPPACLPRSTVYYNTTYTNVHTLYILQTRQTDVCSGTLHRTLSHYTHPIVRNVPCFCSTLSPAMGEVSPEVNGSAHPQLLVTQ